LRNKSLFSLLLFCLVLALIITGITGCRILGGSYGDNVEPVYQDNTTGGTASILTPSSAAIIFPEPISRKMASTASAGMTLIFSTGDAAEEATLKSVAPGNIIVGAENSFFPNGYLRKVLTVQNPAGTFEFETIAASLEEAVSKGTISCNRTFTLDDIESVADEAGIVTIRNAIRPAELAVNFNVDGSVELWKKGPLVLEANLENKISLSLKVEADYDEGLQNFLAQAGFNNSGKFTVSAALSAKEAVSDRAKKYFEKNLTHIYLRRFIIA